MTFKKSIALLLSGSMLAAAALTGCGSDNTAAAVSNTHKQYWALGLHGRAMERQVVLQIIHAYCKYLHLFSLLWLFYFSTFCPMRALTASRERSVREAI